MHPRGRGDIRKNTLVIQHPDTKLEESKIQVAHSFIGKLVVLDHIVQLPEIVNTDVRRVSNNIVHLSVIILDGKGVAKTDIPFHVVHAVHCRSIVQSFLQLAEIRLIQFDCVDVGFKSFFQTLIALLDTDVFDTVSGNSGNDDVSVACAVVHKMVFKDAFGPDVLGDIEKHIHDIQRGKYFSFFFQCVLNHSFIPAFSSTIALAEL